MATVTELQAELLAALLNSGVSSETVIQAVRALEKQMKPDFQKLEKLVNGTNNEQDESYSEASGPDAQNITSSLSELESSGQSIAEQLLRHDPWQSAKIIKQYMQQHNIPQREAVETTGLNQSHLSQHLNKGTPMKTQKRMTLYKWFEAKQKDVAAQYNSISGKRQSEHEISPANTVSPYKRSRRNRFKWGHASTEILYEAYDSQRNPSKEERELLVKACNDAECEQRGIPLEQVNNLGPNLVTESRVYNWFANRRKEEAFKVKLAMDAGTYPLVGGLGSGSTVETKPPLTTSEKPIMPKPPPLPSFVTHTLTKFTDSLPAERVITPRTHTAAPTSTTPLARLPTMSLIKFEPSPPPVATQSPTVSYGHQMSAGASALLQRPISVAFGAMPHQILTPAQLQVITGLVPGQMLPMSHAATGIVGQPGEIGTPGAIAPGHMTNLMLPSHLSIMPMTSGQPQVLYSMSSQSSVPPALISSTVSTSLPISTHFPGHVTAAPVVVQSVGSRADVRIQHQSPMPQIATVHGASTMQTGSINASLPNQISRQVVAPVSIESQIPAPSTIRTILSKQDLPSVFPTRVQSPSAAYASIPSLRPDDVTNGMRSTERVLNPGSVLKPEDTLNTEGTLVVEMKPVDEGIDEDKVVQSLDSTQKDHHDPPMPIAFVTEGEEVAEEMVSGNEFIKEPTLTLSEEGVVKIDEVSRNALQAEVKLHTVVESSE